MILLIFQMSALAMVPEMKIPGHITALYVFAVVNLMALFHVTLVDANIIIVSTHKKKIDVK